MKMPTQIDFYILPDQEVESRDRALCRLLTKSIQGNHRVLIWVNDQEEGEFLSNRIWNAGPETFLPHGIETEAPDEKIVISWNNIPDNQTDILINLSKEVPTFFKQFERVIEIGCQHPDLIQDNRNHYQFYKIQGNTPEVHQLKSQM